MKKITYKKRHGPVRPVNEKMSAGPSSVKIWRKKNAARKNIVTEFAEPKKPISNRHIGLTLYNAGFVIYLMFTYLNTHKYVYIKAYDNQSMGNTSKKFVHICFMFFRKKIFTHGNEALNMYNARSCFFIYIYRYERCIVSKYIYIVPLN